VLKKKINRVKQPTFDNTMVKQAFDNIFTSYDHWQFLNFD